MRFIDLFCGIGGFRLALESLGHTCVFSSEIDENAREVYEKNFKEYPHGDITKIDAKDIPKHDIICAGFPCQSYSISGKREGLNDSRGQLIWEITRIVKHHKPQLILLENVKNILSIDGGKTIKAIETAFNKIGYNFNYHLLNASDYGIPQSRERVYFVCIRKDLDWKYTPPKPTKRSKFLEDVLQDKDIDHLIIDRQDIQLFNVKETKERKPIKIGIISKGRQGERIYSTKGHAITLSASGGGIGSKTGLYLHNGNIRKLSQKEVKKLMTFPVKHKVSDGAQGYKQLGNAIMPKMVKLVFKSIKEIG